MRLTRGGQIFQAFRSTVAEVKWAMSFAEPPGPKRGVARLPQHLWVATYI